MGRAAETGWRTLFTSVIVPYCPSEVRMPLPSRLIGTCLLFALSGSSGLLVIPGCAAQGSAGAGARGSFGKGLREVPATPRIRELERQMAERLNADRKAQGRPPLRYDDRLASVARSHSADMRDHGFLEHASPTTGLPEDRLNAAGYLFLVARENLAQADTVERAEVDLMKSPRHHENIMADDVTHVGIGIVDAGPKAASKLLFTQLFARPAQLETPKAARATLSARIQQARRAKGLGPLAEERALGDMAQAELGGMPDNPGQSDLNRMRDALSARLARHPVPGVRGLVVSGQVLADTSAFEVSEALLRPRARSYGMAVERSSERGKRPMLRVLILVGQ
jgi:uncharacterized protein YkwD